MSCPIVGELASSPMKGKKTVDIIKLCPPFGQQLLRTVKHLYEYKAFQLYEINVLWTYVWDAVNILRQRKSKKSLCTKVRKGLVLHCFGLEGGCTSKSIIFEYIPLTRY